MTVLEIDIVTIVGKKKSRKRKRKEMEIKTCEEYVVTKVMRLDEEVENLKQQVKELTAIVELNEKDFEFVKKVLDIHMKLDYDGDRTVYCSGFYESKYNNRKDDFDRIMRIFNLKLEDEEEEE